ncbi:MAG: hypothetical protein PHY29_10265, partial [Syntrophales bacterium]|nr:hypothetical protein [Syntrophales bacterium]
GGCTVCSPYGGDGVTVSRPNVKWFLPLALNPGRGEQLLTLRFYQKNTLTSFKISLLFELKNLFRSK